MAEQEVAAPSSWKNADAWVNAALEPAKEEAVPERDEQGRFTSSEPNAQESAPADAPEETAEPEAKAETAPESGTDDNPQEQDEPVKGKEAEKRIRQLVAEVKELRALVTKPSDVKPESSTGKDVKAESSTAAPALHVSQLPADLITQLKDIEENPDKYGVQTWPEVVALQNAVSSSYFSEQRLARFRSEQAIEKALGQRLEDSAKAYDNFNQDAALAAYRTVGGSAEIPPQVIEYLAEEEDLFGILGVIGADTEFMAAFVNKAKASPIQAIKQINEIKNELTRKSEKPAPEPKTEVRTRAPKPITPITGSAPADSSPRDADSAEVWADKDAQRRGFKNWREEKAGIRRI